MTNIIQFPSTNETQQVDDASDFAHKTLHVVHDVFHDTLGDCILSNVEYDSLVFLLVEVLSAFHAKAQNKPHPMQEIADDLYNFVDMDDDTDYNVSDIKVEDE